MNNILIFFTSVLFITSCGSCERKPQNQKLTYQNIVILADLSSRLDNKLPKDTSEIRKLIEFFRNDCVKPGEKIGDRSSISFSTFSEKVVTNIDIEVIKNLDDKQKFINSKGKFQNNGLNYQIGVFEQKVKSTYANIRNNGLDLISLLIEKINNEPIIKKDTFFIDDVDTTFIKYDNHIYIFTDGYLEYLNKSSNSQFYFGSPQIDKVRQYCKKNKLDIKTALYKNPSLGLPPTKNEYNKSITLHILETQDRGFDSKLLEFKYTTGQRDNEILEAVWRKWANDSGFKYLQWKTY